MFSFFFRSAKNLRPLLTDFHSHLLPGVDDGAKTSSESFALIDKLMEYGYARIITTPHIMTDYYGNTAESLAETCRQFIPELRAHGYSIPFECAAEYYFDEKVFMQVQRKEKMMTFGQGYFLFETNAVSEPLQLKEFIFALTTQGYRPVLAHPERYQYMTVAKAEDLRDRGVLLQLNILSLLGYYGPPIQKLATKLIDLKLADAMGSDCHNMDHAILLKNAQRTKAYRKALDLPLLNYTL